MSSPPPPNRPTPRSPPTRPPPRRRTLRAGRVTISVGRGQLRSVQSLSQTEFDNALAGSSPLATVARLPGVNFQSADGLGNYEWSTTSPCRGFSQNQIGFTLDDVPLGDMSTATSTACTSAARSRARTSDAPRCRRAPARWKRPRPQPGRHAAVLFERPAGQVRLPRLADDRQRFRRPPSLPRGQRPHGGRRLLCQLHRNQDADKVEGDGKRKQSSGTEVDQGDRRHACPPSSTLRAARKWTTRIYRWT